MVRGRNASDSARSGAPREEAHFAEMPLPPSAPFGQAATGAEATRDILRDILRDIATSLAAQDKRAEEEKAGTAGTMSSVTEEDKLLVFAARGFDRFE
eukprot:48715-Amphidinium_carterae.1